MNIKTKKSGQFLYDELVRPMQILAKRNKKLNTKKMSEIRARMIKDIEIMHKRKINLS